MLPLTMALALVPVAARFALAPEVPVATHDPFTFRVYRAVDSYADDAWSGHLQAKNAADLSGLLGYLHTEVVPVDKGACTFQYGFERNSKIDAVELYEVTMMNPEPMSTDVGEKCKNVMATPPHNGYTTFDEGNCIGIDCPMHQYCGNFVGEQSILGNPDHHYYDYTDPNTRLSAGHLYSFPAGGWCRYPTSDFNCTYSYKPIGLLTIDNVVNAYNTQSEQIAPFYSTWCQESKQLEFWRNVSNKCQTFSSTSFWKDPCDQEQCQLRTQFLMSKAVEKMYKSLDTNGCKYPNNFKYTKWGCQPSCEPDHYITWDWRCQPCADVMTHCGGCSDFTSPDQTASVCTACDTRSFVFTNSTDQLTCVETCPQGYMPDKATYTHCVEAFTDPPTKPTKKPTKKPKPTR